MKPVHLLVAIDLVLSFSEVRLWFCLFDIAGIQSTQVTEPLETEMNPHNLCICMLQLLHLAEK